MQRFLMLADDFTGAGDSGVQMVKNGIETHIVFDAAVIRPGQSYVIDTETRNVPEEAAYTKVRRILELLQNQTFDHYYKKVDSTLRGNIGKELQAAAEILQPELIVFNPANPDAGRTVVDGILKLNGVRVCETDIMKDPLSRVKEDQIRRYMEQALEREVQHISLEDIRGGVPELNGAGILTFDFLENSDCDVILDFLLKQKKKILWAGSAGMANRLFRRLGNSVSEAANDCGGIRKQSEPANNCGEMLRSFKSANDCGKPVLCLAGSISEVTRRQVKDAVSKGAKRIALDIAGLLNGSSPDEAVKEIIEQLRQKKDVIVVTAEEYEDYQNAVNAGVKLGMDRADVARYTQKMLGELSKAVLQECEVGGLFLTGGDTAISVCEANGANGAKIVREVMPVIPLLKLDGGLYPDLPCVVKAGAMGEEHAIAEAIRFLKCDMCE